jgi:phage gp46-like protein
MSTFGTYFLPSPPAQTTAPARASALSISDVRLFHTPDGGDIAFENGLAVLSDGLDSAAYLSLFGGNEDDAGLPADVSKQWWGNFSESNTSRRYRSETQYALATLPPTTGNLRRIESAATNDLAWFIADGFAESVTPMGSMPALNHIRLDVVFVIDGQSFVVSFDRPWGVPNR